MRNENSKYRLIWEFEVKAGAEREFERVYGPAGDWAQFFRRGQGYIRTELLLDAARPARYLTIDSWTSRAACDAFRERFAAEYQALDARGERLTVREAMLGAFHHVD